MKIRIIASVICSVVFLASVFGTVIILNAAQDIPESVEAAAIAEQTPELLPVREEGSSYYVLKEYGGSICVFNGGYREIPAIITDIAIDKLPAEDRELLIHGIVVYSKEELLSLLEDFGS